MADTRKDRRAPVSLKVRFKSATVDEFVEQYAMDISRGGIFIKSKSPMPIGTLLKFEFQLKDESRLIHGVGRVVWKRDGGEPDKPPGMGIKFIKMDPQSRSLVEQIVSQRGDSPGEFEQGRQKVKSVKKTEAFFPAPLPRDQLPAPEDSTQVRHASEFLAEALSAGDEDAAKEAAESAERARKRGEEIAKEREEAARREKETAGAKSQPPAAEAAEAASAAAGADAADADAEVTPTKPADEAGVAESASEAAAEKSAKTADEEAKTADEEAKTADEEAKKADEEEKAATAATAARRKAEAEAARREREPAEAKKRQSGRPAKAAASAAEPEEPRSMMLPIAIGVVAMLGIGYFVWSQQQHTEGTDDLGSVVDEASETSDELAAEDAGAADDAAEMATGFPEDAEMVDVRVATLPPGAVVEIAGEAQDGQTPFAIQLPVGHEIEVVVRKDGYVSGRMMVTAEADQAPLTFELEELPWVVAVNVTPSEARVMSGGTTPNELGEITLAREPAGPVSVSASFTGYVSATEQVPRTAFSQEGERMLARLDITLEERARGPRPTMATFMAMTMATMDAAGDEGGDEPEVATMEPTMEPAMAMEAATMEPTMEAATMEPTMEAATMEPAGGVPDNPF